MQENFFQLNLRYFIIHFLRKTFKRICFLGETGWGIAWYINGVLIPEITLERGKTYTFIVEGGNDPENSARSHPFYITDDPEGGYDYKTAEERKVNILLII